jgi:hypothetical protein
MEGIDPSVAEKDVAGLRIQLRKRTTRKQRVLWYSIAASVTVLMILSSIFIFTEKRELSEQLSYAPVTQQSKDLQTLNDRPKTETKPPTAVPVEKKQPAAAGTERSIESPAKTKETENKSDKKFEIREEKISAENHELIRVEEVTEPDQVYAAEKAMPAKSVRAGKTSDTVMEFKPDSSAVNLNEIVVVGYGARGAGDEAEEAMNEYTPPHPVNGRADFDKYIRENIRRPDITTTGQRAVVVLNFIVNAVGKIDSIRIIRSPGKIFSDEAIRLIKEGPEWKAAEQNGNAISDEVRIRIVFK